MHARAKLLLPLAVLLLGFLGALALFPALSLSIDVVSLFAFILVLGLLVDDAIVVRENVHSHQERAEDPLDAAIVGIRFAVDKICKRMKPDEGVKELEELAKERSEVADAILDLATLAFKQEPEQPD